MLGKTRLKQLLYGVELRSTAIIANGLVHKVPKKVILDTIKSDLLVSNKHIHLNSAEINRFWTSFYSRYVKVSKKVFVGLRKTDKNYKENLEARQNLVYQELRRSVLPVLEREKNDVANDVDRRFKQENLRNLTETGIFYLCSTHEKPAKDHADWEGRVYVSEDWMSRCSDDDEKTRISEYIRKNHIRTVEWVTGAPVYLIYRPNCKHYFIPVTVEEVLGNPIKRLLKEHKAVMPNEIPLTYEKAQYKDYYEKHKALLYLSKMCPSDELKKDIAATRRLMLKWAARARNSK